MIIFYDNLPTSAGWYVSVSIELKSTAYRFDEKVYCDSESQRVILKIRAKNNILRKRYL